MNAPGFTPVDKSHQSDDVMPSIGKFFITNALKAKYNNIEKMLGIPPDVDTTDIGLFIEHTEEKIGKIIAKGKRRKFPGVVAQEETEGAFNVQSVVTHLLNQKNNTSQSNEKTNISWKKLNKLLDDAVRTACFCNPENDKYLSSDKTDHLFDIIIRIDIYFETCDQFGTQIASNIIRELADKNEIFEILYQRDAQSQKIREIINQIEKLQKGVNRHTGFPVLIFDDEQNESLYFGLITLVKMIEFVENTIRSVL